LSCSAGILPARPGRSVTAPNCNSALQCPAQSRPADEPHRSGCNSAHSQKNQSRLTSAATNRKRLTGAMRAQCSAESLATPLAPRFDLEQPGTGGLNEAATIDAIQRFNDLTLQ